MSELRQRVSEVFNKHKDVICAPDQYQARGSYSPILFCCQGMRLVIALVELDNPVMGAGDVRDTDGRLHTYISGFNLLADVLGIEYIQVKWMYVASGSPLRPQGSVDYDGGPEAIWKRMVKIEKVPSPADCLHDLARLDSNRFYLYPEKRVNYLLHLSLIHI